MLVVAVTSVDAYSFFGFLRPDLSPSGYRNRCFLDPLCCLVVRRPNLEVVIKILLHQQVKKTGIVLVRVSTWKYVPTVTFGGADISKLPWCHLLQQMSSH